MKRIIICVLSLILAFVSLFAIGCDSSFDNKEKPQETTKFAYINESVAFENGVDFRVSRYAYKKEIQLGFSHYTTQDTFLFIEVIVKNNSNSDFIGTSGDVWLLYGKTKISQIDMVFSLDNGYCNISQPATTTKTYVSCFELSADIPFEDLTLVFDNGKWLDNEQVKILLKNRPSA